MDLSEFHLTEEPPYLVTAGVVADSLAPYEREFADGEDWLDKAVLEVLKAKDVTITDPKPELVKIFKPKFGPKFHESNIADCYIKLSLQDVEFFLTEDYKILQGILGKELKMDETSTKPRFLKREESSRKIYQNILNDKKGLMILSLDHRQFLSWQEWLDWLWFDYKPNHGLADTHDVIIKVTNVRLLSRPLFDAP